MWFVILLGLVLLLLYLLLRRAFGFWKRHGVDSPSSYSLITGHMGPFFKLQETEVEVLGHYYDQAKSRGILGIYYFWKPVLLVTDIELIKTILTNGFEDFIDHPKLTDLKGVDRIGWSLFLMKGEEWKSRRAFFGKLFTPLRLKRLYDSVEENCKEILPVLDKLVGEDVELEDVVQRYTINVITVSMFGLSTDTIDNSNSVFVKAGRLVASPPLSTIFKSLVYLLAPRFASAIGLEIFHKDIWAFFSRFIKDIVEERESRTDRSQTDLLETMIQLKNSDNLENAMTVEEMTGHAYAFFQAGYDTTTITTSYCLYELSINPHLQERLRKEVDRVIEKHGGRLSYQAVQEMPFMDNVIAETLRLYPPAGVIKRECCKEYKLSNFTIPVGMHILIPVHALHNDPEYFTNPEEFNPDRFEDPKLSLNSVYLPFGKGPRTCIGKKLAEMEIKIALSLLLRNYKFEPSGKMIKPLKYDTKTLFISNRPATGVWIKLQKRATHFSSIKT